MASERLSLRQRIALRSLARAHVEECLTLHPDLSAAECKQHCLEATQADLDAMGVTIDPATIIAIVEAIFALIELIKKLFNK